MAVAENVVGTKIDASGDNLDKSVVSSDSTEVEKSKPKSDQNLNTTNNNSNGVPNGNHGFMSHQMGQMHVNGAQNQLLVVNNGGESFNREMRDLEELLSKLNPMAEEFVPPSLITNYQGYLAAGPNAGFGYPNNFMIQNNSGNANGQINRRVWMFCLISFYLYDFLGFDLCYMFFLIVVLSCRGRMDIIM